MRPFARRPRVPETGTAVFTLAWLALACIVLAGCASSAKDDAARFSAIDKVAAALNLSSVGQVTFDHTSGKSGISAEPPGREMAAVTATPVTGARDNIESRLTQLGFRKVAPVDCTREHPCLYRRKSADDPAELQVSITTYKARQSVNLRKGKVAIPAGSTGIGLLIIAAG